MTGVILMIAKPCDKRGTKLIPKLREGAELQEQSQCPLNGDLAVNDVRLATCDRFQLIKKIWARMTTRVTYLNNSPCKTLNCALLSHLRMPYYHSAATPAP
jgi:hypothetical protein